MQNTSFASIPDIHKKVGDLLLDLAGIYTDLHAHPELSMHEVATAKKVSELLRSYGYEVTTGVGKTGVVGILENGGGPVVMLRADMDALPIKEETHLSYASSEVATDRNGETVPVMHACGHDMHMTCVIGASRLMADIRADWKGTLIVVLQPAEETSEGARAMIDDGFFSRFPRPDVILGQHVINTPAGSINVPSGPATSAGDSLQIRLTGRGSHGAMPENAIDPIVMAASVILRLQTIVSREIPADEPAIISIGSLHAGTRENIIPDEAVLKINVRTYSHKIRKQVLEAIERIVRAEAAASGAEIPPEITTINHFPLVQNESAATQKIVESFRRYLPAESVRQLKPTKMSDDFGEFSDASGVPAVYWFIGSTEPEVYAQAEAENKLADLPTNHNPKFAPLVNPTIKLGVQTMVIGALSWLA